MASSARLPDGLRVAVFAKAPVPGQVKTRLAPLLGAEGAAALHAQLVRRALSTAVAADSRRGRAALRAGRAPRVLRALRGANSAWISSRNAERTWASACETHSSVLSSGATRWL
jgi:hypothetical protein